MGDPWTTQAHTLNRTRVIEGGVTEIYVIVHNIPRHRMEWTALPKLTGWLRAGLPFCPQRIRLGQTPTRTSIIMLTMDWYLSPPPQCLVGS